MSSFHHENRIEQESGPENKPFIRTFYSGEKRGVDAADKVFTGCDISRNSKKLPLNVFLLILNTARINSIVIITRAK